MLIRDLTINNFGIYGGTHTFRLNPNSGEDEKSLVLFIGKNGVGKTTLVETLKLVLWGSISVRDKLSQKKYEEYLASKLHQPKGTSKSAEEASISIIFDYVRLGEKNQYVVKRSWKKTSSGVNESILIIENEQELDQLDYKEKELFLRDLFPPGYKDLFFFDGEKLNMFDRDDSTSILSGTIRSLLGLETVDQLQEDISYYLKEESKNQNFGEITTQLENVEDRIKELLDKQLEVKTKIRELNEEKKEINQELIPEKESQISKHGRWDQSKLEKIKKNKNKLEEKIENLQKQLIEQCNGLIPFAVTPRYLDKLKEQLKQEKNYKTWSISEDLINKQVDLFESKETLIKLKEETDTSSESELQDILNILKQDILKTLPEKPLEESELTHHLSDEEHEKFMSWIRASKSKIPSEFNKIAQKVIKTRSKLSDLEEELSWSANEEFSQPLFEELGQLNQRLGKINSKIEEFRSKEEDIEGKIDYHKKRRDNLEEKLKDKGKLSQSIQLAHKSKELLEEYAEELKNEKLSQLGDLIVNKFNLLCRKELIFDSVKIDPNDFAITLLKNETKFDKNSLSAGEKQILSLSILWALYDISKLPAPIIVDTPLSRLDTVHRKNLTEHFFSKATHQMLILGTDEEINKMVTDKLTNYISHMYDMQFNPSKGSTEKTKINGQEIEEHLIPVEA
ncbi:DNA sulfur modification protein DndD [Fodinibius sp. AD559]|uniref:DNA sulfur modification protein DndD n=1 Tax=Fodinibius sp. AD559 TaxID=3424179 RepID=UPI004046E8C8